MKIFENRKTYISAILMIFLAGLKATGYIDESTYQIIFGLLAGAGLIFLRRAVGN